MLERNLHFYYLDIILGDFISRRCSTKNEWVLDKNILYKASQDPNLKVTGSQHDVAGCDGGLSEVRKEVDLMRDND